MRLQRIPVSDDDRQAVHAGSRRGESIDSTPWLAVAGGCLAVFAVLLACIHFAPVVRADRSLELDVHHVLGRAWYGFFTLVTQVGSVQVRVTLIVLLCAALAWRRHWSGMAFLLTAVAGASLLETIFKVIVGRARPELFRHAVSAAGSSFPSGHATDIASLSFALAVLLWAMPRLRVIVLPALVLLVLLVGLSRIVLGVHYPSDVIAGYALGCGWAALLLAAAPRARRLAAVSVRKEEPAESGPPSRIS